MSVNGDPEQVAPELLGLGTRLFVLSVDGPSFDLATVRDWLAFRDEANTAAA